MKATIEGYERAFRYTLETEPEKGQPEDRNDVVAYIKAMLPSMAKWQVEALGQAVRHHYMARFKKNGHRPKYGNLNKGFTEHELQAFLKAVDNPKMRLAFEFQANLGLRIGEVVRVNINNVNFETQELTLKTEKSGLLDTLKIPLPLFKATLDFVHEHTKEIEYAKGYLFFKESPREDRTETFIEPNYLRNKFREYLIAAGLDETYGISEEAEGRPLRRLHRLTTHSLRHYAITRFARTTNGNLILTSRFARHTDPSTTTTYINTDKREIYDVIDAIAVSEVALLKKRLNK